MMDVNENTKDETTTAYAASPEAIRELRERLGLSRRDVELGTELSSSVVWRSEQVGRNVTDAERANIWSFLVKYEVDHPDGKSTRKARAKKPNDDESMVDSLAAAAKHWEKATWGLRHVIDDVYAQATAALNEAKAKKRSTADLKAIVDALRPHISD